MYKLERDRYYKELTHMIMGTTSPKIRRVCQQARDIGELTI